jgi:D-3-phosphoglycerate dehydrogenase
MVKKVLILGKIHDSGVQMLRDAGGLDIVEMQEHVPEIFDELPDTDAIVVRMTKITREVAKAAPNLKVVARHGVGYEAVDVDALTDFGVPLTITGDVNSLAVAEHTLALMLGLAKKIVAFDKAVRADHFSIRDGFSQTELSGKTVLLAGFGRIGREVAKRCAAFGMRVQIADPFVTAAQVEGDGYAYVEVFKDALPGADYVCLHVPKTPETTNLISTPELHAMKNTAHVLNVSRGGIIDEAALYTALKEGWIGGAALDVFDPEPPKSDNPLLTLDNIIVSPHCGAFTQECAQRMAEACARSVLDALAGNVDPSLVINKEALSA